ncbi:hypothetical protein [Falsiroseomonas tokyonensis]|uniref:Uncharacterized protein n=1 Tax=Falsiroseomonas tokyonensis TaxID=430521 RepID=A0ABV7BYI1_9PROT|nr:hypothetical protein [Falsiroseomonas tokyonensis]MBU8539695.1 hypothetical protein [Falsiroseomonas tokyonensis]
MSSHSRRLLLLAPLALAACTGLPQPFRGRPGAVARRLRVPPGYRIAVPNSTQLLLTDADSASLSRALAEGLVANEVPAVAGPALPLDWQLAVVAERQGVQVVPRYALRDADGRALGMLVGQPVPARDWAEGGAALHERIAGEVAPQLATLVGRIDAQRRTGDEAASGSGPPVLRLLPVRGAPGDGNRSLTARMRDSLAGLGFRVQEEAEGAQFAVQGEVTVVPSGRGLQRVEIVWIVSRRDGEDLGRVLQLNEVPSGTLAGLWGDVAYVVAEEASTGVRDVVFNAGGFPGAAGAQAAPSASPATGPAATPAAAR